MKHDKTILLVEDEILIAMAEKYELEKSGYRIIHAMNGLEAISVLENNPAIRLILMDIDLGKGMNGIDVAQKILELRELPIIFISNNTEPQIVDTARMISGYGFLAKSSGFGKLDLVIKSAFNSFYSETL